MPERVEQGTVDGGARVRTFTTVWRLAGLDGPRCHWGHQRWCAVGPSMRATLALQHVTTRPQDAAGPGYVSGVGVVDRPTPFDHIAARRVFTEPAAHRGEVVGVVGRFLPGDADPLDRAAAAGSPAP